MSLAEQEIKDKLSALQGWDYLPCSETPNDETGATDRSSSGNGEIHCLQKTYSLESFDKAMKLANQAAMIAENLGHHPDMDIRFNKITFKLSTHSEGGVTEKDFALAKEIEQAAIMIL